MLLLVLYRVSCCCLCCTGRHVVACVTEVLSPRGERQVGVERGIRLMQEGMSPGCEGGRKEQLLREFVQLRHAEDERLTELAKENTFLRQVSGGTQSGGSVRGLTEGESLKGLIHSQCSMLYNLHRTVVYFR